jgi:hypothetical protein
MSADENAQAGRPPQTSRDESNETLTDLIDRMDREAFHRALEQRDLRSISSSVRASRSDNSAPAVAIAPDPA